MSQCARVLAVLKDGQPKTIQEIHARAGTMRLNSRMSDLRKQGYDIRYWREGQLHVYQLVNGGVGDLAVTSSAPISRREASEAYGEPHSQAVLVRPHSESLAQTAAPLPSDSPPLAAVSASDLAAEGIPGGVWEEGESAPVDCVGGQLALEIPKKPVWA